MLVTRFQDYTLSLTCRTSLMSVVCREDQLLHFDVPRHYIMRESSQLKRPFVCKIAKSQVRVPTKNSVCELVEHSKNSAHGRLSARKDRRSFMAFKVTQTCVYSSEVFSSRISCFQISLSSRVDGVNNFGFPCRFRSGTPVFSEMSAAGSSGLGTPAFRLTSDPITRGSSLGSVAFECRNDVNPFDFDD